MSLPIGVGLVLMSVSFKMITTLTLSMDVLNLIALNIIIYFLSINLVVYITTTTAKIIISKKIFHSMKQDNMCHTHVYTFSNSHN